MRHGVFVALLFAAMAAATLAPAALGILATFVIDDLNISRATLGWLVSTNVIVAALFSPFAGLLTDRLGGKAAIIAVFGTSAAAFALFGLTTALALLFVGSAVAALSQAGGNPSTNTLIGQVLPRGERGVVTGIKQSGVQAGIALAGLTLPAIAIAVGWRGAMLLVAAGPIAAGILAVFVVPSTEAGGTERAEESEPMPPSIRWLTAYGFVFGFAGAVTFFLPLFAEEALGFDPRLAGAAAALGGVVAFGSRILWARRAERRNDYTGPLGTMAILGMAAAALFLASTTIVVLVWAAVILTGMSTSAWNSVGMLAVINEAGAPTGRASGVVLLGFLLGLGIGPPLYGATVDATGSYTAMWLLSLLAAGLSLWLVVAWRQRSGIGST
jgi:predicted MFS family arabinose efflux permease